MLFEGDANVIVDDGVIIDTLNSCYCWRTQDSLGVSIFRLGFGGIRIDISERIGKISPAVVYYSDYDEFDGKFVLETKLYQITYPSDLKT